jgi:hypothetical protein
MHFKQAVAPLSGWWRPFLQITHWFVLPTSLKELPDAQSLQSTAPWMF